MIDLSMELMACVSRQHYQPLPTVARTRNSSECREGKISMEQQIRLFSPELDDPEEGTVGIGDMMWRRTIRDRKVLKCNANRHLPPAPLLARAR